MHFARLLFFAIVAITVSARSLTPRHNDDGGSDDEDCDYSDGCEGSGSDGGHDGSGSGGGDDGSGRGDGSDSNGGSGSTATTPAITATTPAITNGCNIATCVLDLAHTVTSCASAAAEDGVNPIADGICITDALQELSDLPSTCSGCLNFGHSSSTTRHRTPPNLWAVAIFVGILGQKVFYSRYWSSIGSI
ncbi:hypothetical protein B0H14DRAFT_3862294 [Mycena olivaceomarginata]|nr:hypothetical protein B0H14DRAFT_3872473 [Mycena olivaceomarginata]KAJ7865124.1 hypothetical protein B0H14DRAFT_3862294 [Mycena olivaceomarginata]